MTTDDLAAAMRQAFRLGQAFARLKDGETADDQLRAGGIEERFAMMLEHVLVAARAAGLERGIQPQYGSLQDRMRDAERDIVAACLHKHFHNVTRAAQQLRVSRMTLYRIVKKHGLDLGREPLDGLIGSKSLPVQQGEKAHG